jgi:hypothetical protein
MQTKICAKCNIEKEVSEFPKNGKSFRTICKCCSHSLNIKQKELRLSLVKKGFKLCTKCGEEKKLKCFYPDKRKRFNVTSQCIECMTLTRNSQKSQHRERNLKRNYNITLEIYNKILESQNSRCAICGKEETVVIRKNLLNLAVDHDHKTGKVRGLLCGNCNQLLGKANDSVELLNNAIKYLNKG